MQTVYTIKKNSFHFRESWAHVQKKYHQLSEPQERLKLTAFKSSLFEPCHKQVRIWRRELGLKSSTTFFIVLQLPILKIMLARSHKLLVETDLSERFSKYWQIVSIPFSWGTLGYNPSTSKETSIASSWILSISLKLNHQILQSRSVMSSNIWGMFRRRDFKW